MGSFLLPEERRKEMVLYSFNKRDELLVREGVIYPNRGVFCVKSAAGYEVYGAAKKPGVVYMDRLWLNERDDRAALDFFMDHYRLVSMRANNLYKQAYAASLRLEEGGK